MAIITSHEFARQLLAGPNRQLIITPRQSPEGDETTKTADAPATTVGHDWIEIHAACEAAAITVECEYSHTAEQIASFKKIVTAHMEQLPAGEWRRLRSMCNLRKPPAASDSAPNLSPKELTDVAFCEDGMKISELLTPPRGSSGSSVSTASDWSADQIGMIEGAPVYYIAKPGIYAYGPEGAPTILSIWITHPSYPPGW